MQEGAEQNSGLLSHFEQHGLMTVVVARIGEQAAAQSLELWMRAGQARTRAVNESRTTEPQRQQALGKCMGL